MSDVSDEIRELNNQIAALERKMRGASPAEAEELQKQIDQLNWEIRMLAHGGNPG